MAAKRIPVEERLLKWTRRNENTGCLEWVGWSDRDGYGRIKVDGKKRRATHMSLEVWTGQKIGTGQIACHHCDNPPCIEPTHLYVGTSSDNERDAYSRGKKNHNSRKEKCVRGHDLVGLNADVRLYKTKAGVGRCCNACRRERYREKRMANPS